MNLIQFNKSFLENPTAQGIALWTGSVQVGKGQPRLLMSFSFS